MIISNTKAWELLDNHSKNEIKNCRIEDLINDKARSESLSVQLGNIDVDFTKQKLSKKTLELLMSLAEESGLKESIKRFASGKIVNFTENRAALHTACRFSTDSELEVEGAKITDEIEAQLLKTENIVEKLSTGSWRGYSGKPITDVVNLGVGGSDLGPLLVSHALDEFNVRGSNNIKTHFASTMDGSQISEIFNNLNPETTVFVVVSKSFSTVDTLSNAATAKAWLLSNFDDELIICKQHFIGISADKDRMSEWGIHPEHQLKLWDWVGGRFSLWSPVGLTIALKIGMDNFRSLLNGANTIDKHFFFEEFSKNIPVIMGLIGIWNTNFLNISAQAILPYDARLKYFPSYLMQLEMESNGKSVTQHGEPIDYMTCPITWGEVGPNAQHAFYQLLHQGTRKVSCDFIAPINRFADENSIHGKSLQEQHLLTLANCFAQSRALMVGGSSSKSEPSTLGSVFLNTTPGSSNLAPDDILSSHKNYLGDQPSTTILLSELTPYSLGQLIAIYEHKVFVMASIWGINPFDQWGVELGKEIAEDVLSELVSEKNSTKFDLSTNNLLSRVKSSIVVIPGNDER